MIKFYIINSYVESLPQKPKPKLSYELLNNQNWGVFFISPFNLQFFGF